MLYLPSYLARNRLGVFYFRVVFPKDLRIACPAVPNEIRRSLRTREPMSAKTAARIMGANFHELLRVLYHMKNSGVPPSKWLVGFADNGRVSVQKEDGDNPADLAQIIAAFLQAGKMTSEAASDPIARMAFNPSRAEVKEVDQINRSKKNAGRGEWLSEAIERFHQEKQASDWKDDNTWTSAYEPTLRHFRELISEEKRNVTVDGKTVPIYDIPVGEIYHEHIRNYKTDMLKFPGHFGQADRGASSAKMTAKDAMREFKDRKPQSHSTARKKYGFVKAFLNWASIDSCIREGAGFAQILPSKGGKKKGDGGYAAFTTKDLKLLFESQEYKDGFDTPSKYWIPIIGLYTGARLNEIAQLEVNDIVVMDGIRCFSINDTPDDDESDGVMEETAPTKTLKTTASNRHVPIHPEIIKAGLDDYIEEVKRNGAKRLFDSLKWNAKNHFGGNPSKEFREYTKLKGVYIARKKVFHSFRRTLNEALQKAGMHLEHREQLLGHTSRSVNNTYYGGQKPLILINDFLAKYSHGLTHPPYVRPVSLEGIL